MKPAVTVPDSPASAIKTTMTAIPELFHRLRRNVLSIFSGRNLLWHALAIVLTVRDGSTIVRGGKRGFRWGA